MYYDVAVSTDNKTTFNNIANHITGTNFNWTSAPATGEGWFRVTGYSIDTTLVGTKISDTSVVFGATGIEEVSNAKNISVYPNPFNETTVLSYELKKGENVQLDILNVNGELVKKFEEEFQSSGKHQLEWNTNNVAAGIYFYRLKVGNNFMNGKLVKKE